jgi:hypothetical protein
VSIYNFWITDSTSASTHLYYLIYIFKELFRRDLVSGRTHYTYPKPRDKGFVTRIVKNFEAVGAKP